MPGAWWFVGSICPLNWMSKLILILMYIYIYKYDYTYTLPETNIAPTNGWLEYYFPIGEACFQGLR